MRALQATLVEEEFTSALKANYVLEDLSGKGSFCERKFTVPNAEFDEALSRTYGHIAEVLQKLCSSSTILMAEESTNITSWKLLFVDFVDDLRLDVLCERVFKTVTFRVSFVQSRVIWDSFLDQVYCHQYFCLSARM